MKSKLVVWGASGHASVVVDIIRLRGDYEIVGLLDDVNPQRHGTEFCGTQVIGGQDQLEILKRRGVHHLIFGFGDCEARLRLSEMVREKGFFLATGIHPRAIIATSSRIGPGTVIAAGAVVNPNSAIGENVIINTCASVDHDCIIEDAAHVGPGVNLGGKVVVGVGTWIGIGATVSDSLHIGAHSVIGAGAVVLDDIPDGVVAYGIPAKVIRRIVHNEH